MPTTVDFNGITSTGSGFHGTPAVTITADMDDGTVVVGDLVTFSTTGSQATLDFFLSDGNISGGDGYYLGTAVFNGVQCFVFGESPVLGSNTEFIAFSNGGMTVQVANAAHSWANNTSTQTLGSEAACFAAGTLISTPVGQCAVEQLTIGQIICTATGIASVKWVGRQSMHAMFAGAKMQPVRISAGALGNGLPHCDLTITADHGMVIDGLVINASALVNGTTIDFVPMAELPDRVTYYHVETEDHSVILANGAEAETFIDYADRKAFDNYQEYVDLYGVERIIPEMKSPRISTQRLVPDEVKTRLGIVVPDEAEVLSAYRVETAIR